MQAFHHIPKPERANTPWPLVRMYHPLCTLINPDTVWGEGVEEKQSVFVLWGRYGNELVEVADRAGFFTLDKDLRNVSWTEVSAMGRSIMHVKYVDLQPAMHMHVFLYFRLGCR